MRFQKTGQHEYRFEHRRETGVVYKDEGGFDVVSGRSIAARWTAVVDGKERRSKRMRVEDTRKLAVENAVRDYLAWQ